MAPAFQWIIRIMALLFVVLLILDIGLRIALYASTDSCSSHVIVPKEFVYRYPECARKLVETAGFKNIRIDTLENLSDDLSGMNLYGLSP